jgi:biotin carboxyl carrier protein
MKMETVIRSPQKGVIAKLVHKEGVYHHSVLVVEPANWY